MFLKTTVSQGKTYLQIIKSYRDKQGVVRHKVTANLGRADRLAESGLENIILSLQKFVQPEKKKLHDISTLKEKSRLNYGYILYKKLWNKFSLTSLMDLLVKRKKIKYDFSGVVFSLVINRLLTPSSKRFFYNHRDKFINEYDESLNIDSVYRALDILSENKQTIEEDIFNRNVNLFNMQIDVVFYDVTTYHFESQQSDDLRDFGFSKANKVNEVQVVMGLLIDAEGRPIGYELFRGNTFDGKTMLRVLEKLKKQFKLNEVIIVADKGLNIKINLKEIKDNGFDYIVSSRIKNMNEEIQKEILSENGYKTISKKQTEEDDDNEEYRYKVIDYENKVRYKEDEKYKTIVLKEKLVATYSSKRAAKDKADRERAILKAEETIKEKNYSKLEQKKGFKRFIKTEANNHSINSMKLDVERIEKEKRFDGYSALQYSRENLRAEEVIEQYHRLYKIEESFRVLKSTMQTRPIYLQTQNHIEGHFIICFLAFLLERELEFRLRRRKISASSQAIKQAINTLEFSKIEIEGSNYYLKSKHESLASKILSILRINQPPNLMAQADAEKYIAEQTG